MLDQMSMPVLFIVVFALLAVVSIGLMVVIRILGARETDEFRTRGPAPAAPGPDHDPPTTSG